MSDDLLNLLIAGLGVPHKAFEDPCFSTKGAIRKQIVGEARLSRQELIGAQKFVVSDNLMTHAVMASLVPPERLLDMLEIAIPPFDNMWIEWDDRVRLGELHDAWDGMGVIPKGEKDESKWSERVGFHIQKNSDVGYTADQYYIADMSRKSIGTVPYSIQFTNDGPIPFSTLSQKVVGQYGGVENTAVAFEAQQCADGEILMGGPYMEQWGGRHRRPMTDVFMRTCMTIGKFAGSPILQAMTLRDKHESSLMMKQIKDGSAQAWAGDLRFIWAVLALVNYPHTIIERAYDETKVRRLAYGRSVPRNELRVLEIDLPKPRGTTQYERMFKGGGAKKRRHVRRGHWRRFKHKDGRVSTRWIEEQWVGNAELGTITHDYNLVHKARRAS